MLPSKHFIFGIIFALILLFIFPQIGFTGFFIIIASTILIDIDHYIYYIYKKRSLNLFEAYQEVIQNGIKFNKMSKTQKEEIYFEICIFHGVEAIIFLFILFIYLNSPFYLFILTGFVFHQILDLTEIIKANLFPYKILSSISVFFYSKNKIFLGDYKYN